MYYVTANWKMNMSTKDALKWVRDLSFTPDKNIEVIVAPTFMHIPLVAEALKATGVAISAQDVSLNSRGAHTGDVGAFQLSEFCNYCIVGHSERAEALEIVLQKRDQCLAQGITPIVCFKNDAWLEKLYKKGVIMAREDPEHISVKGQYRAQDPANIRAVFKDLRQKVPKEAVILYGGSVNRQNTPKLVNISELNGFLVGNASLDPSHFAEILYEIRRHI